ncbi:Flagellar motor rotation protein MotB [Olavius sp. associated proteobacterium Delta 1]|nr:Flagellar motor rotation protein MotB [Olavius sp. associated proteobacterium Delta 1]
MRKRSIQRSPASGGNSAGWLTTFNDLMTLLMVFFVLLFTMGSMDNNMMKGFLNALQSGLGIMGAGSRVSIALKQSQTLISQQGQSSQAGNETTAEDEPVASDTIDEALGEFATQPGVRVKYTKAGVRISFEDDLFFNFGKADINANGFAFLDKMAVLIHQIPCAVRVEGHTDNVPIHTSRFPSNWELSIARAVSVVKYFVDVGKINPQRLSAVGYGESRPLVPNDAPARRAKNRRVEIILVTGGVK